MLGNGLGDWLVRCGELVTVVTRVLRECSGVCIEYSLRYLLMLAGLEFRQLCSYLSSGSLSGCREVIDRVCGKVAADRLANVLSVGELLADGVYVDVADLIELATALPELYTCGSRSVFELYLTHSSRSS